MFSVRDEADQRSRWQLPCRRTLMYWHRVSERRLASEVFWNVATRCLIASRQAWNAGCHANTFICNDLRLIQFDVTQNRYHELDLYCFMLSLKCKRKTEVKANTWETTSVRRIIFKLLKWIENEDLKLQVTSELAKFCEESYEFFFYNKVGNLLISCVTRGFEQEPDFMNLLRNLSLNLCWTR
jgi:hypothetical protein